MNMPDADQAQSHDNDAARQQPRYFYEAFGVRLACDFPIGELNAIDQGPVDIDVRFADIPRRRPEVDDAPWFDFSGPEVYLGWPGFARFLIRSPDLIEVDLDPESHATLLALPLLGPVMALLLFKRGYLVLHGSAVAMADQGVMFLGDKEAGKSTTAAAMLAGGCELLSDDVVAIDLKAQPPIIVTAYPSMKLTETASAHFAPAGAALLDRPFADFPKDRFRLSSVRAGAETPAVVAYVLERTSGSMASAILPAGEALSAILRFSYVVRFGEKLLHGPEAARHFQLCAQLSRAVSIRRLMVPNTLEAVANAPLAIAKDLESTQA